MGRCNDSIGRIEVFTQFFDITPECAASRPPGVNTTTSPTTPIYTPIVGDVQCRNDAAGVFLVENNNMPLNVSLQLPNPLLSALLASAIEAEKDLPDFIVGVLNEVMSADKATPAANPEEIAEALYGAIVEENRGCTLGMAWKRKYGDGWKALDASQRVLIGLRFKELIEGIAEGKRNPPGDSDVRLVRCGDTPQGQALYANIEACHPIYG